MHADGAIWAEGTMQPGGYSCYPLYALQAYVTRVVKLVLEASIVYR